MIEIRLGDVDASAAVSYTHLDVYKRQVPDTSQADAHVFLIQSPGHGPGNGCFAGSGRSHQTDDRACLLYTSFC